MKRVLMIGINVIATILHLMLQCLLLLEEGTYAPMMLVENFIVASIYIILAVVLIQAKFDLYSVFLSACFWILFVVCLIVVRPVSTTLNVFLKPSSAQWLSLLAVGTIAALLYVTEIFKIRKRMKNKGE